MKNKIDHQADEELDQLMRFLDAEPPVLPPIEDDTPWPDGSFDDIDIAVLDDFDLDATAAQPGPAPAPARATRPRPKGATDTTTPVSMRIENELLDALRTEAKRRRMGWSTLAQHLMRSALKVI